MNSEILWIWPHYVVVVLLSVIVSFVEIFFEYPKKCVIAFGSIYFYLLVVFNLLSATLLFYLKSINKLPFIRTTDQTIILIVIGLSGFIFFSSKINLKKIDKKNDWLGFKSILSIFKSIINKELSCYIEEEYPFDLLLFISNNLKHEKINDYSTFVKHTVDQFGGKRKNSTYELLNKIDGIENLEIEDRIYYLTEALLDIKDPHWVKNKVVSRFCRH